MSTYTWSTARCPCHIQLIPVILIHTMKEYHFYKRESLVGSHMIPTDFFHKSMFSFEKRRGILLHFFFKRSGGFNLLILDLSEQTKK